MRKPNPANQSAATGNQSNSIRYFLMIVMLLTAVSIAMSGCSKLGLQDFGRTDFEPIPQPKSLTERQQRDIEKVLDRQEEKRVAKKEYTVDPDPLTPEIASQQKDIVASAAERASKDSSEEQQTPIKDSAFMPVSYDQELDDSDDGVRLVAKANSFKGLPENLIRKEVDFSKANFLRPSGTVDSEADTQEMASDENSSLLTPINQAPSQLLPLQPLLFSSETRKPRMDYQGTLRPLSARDEELEADVAIDSKQSDQKPVVEQAVDDSLAVNSRALQPLSPQLSREQFEPNNDLEQSTSNLPNQRLLQPIDKPLQPAVTAAPEVSFRGIASVEASTTGEPTESYSASTIESAEIVVVDPATVANDAAVQFKSASTSSSNFVAADQVSSPSDENMFIPVEVIEDAQSVADDFERELTASSIPGEAVDNEEFKVVPASSTTITSVCRGCGEEKCSGCDADRGEPMFSNNDFGAPSTPDGAFVSPMSVPPVAIDTTVPTDFVPASSNFGKPINLEAPPEVDSPHSHITALPVSHPMDKKTSASDVPPVGISTIMDLNAVTWKSRLDEAIELAETRINQINKPADASLVSLRLLKALRGQMEHVENTPPGDSQLTLKESQYWQHQLEAITTMLETPIDENQALTDYRRHQAAHETLTHLRNAVAQLESIASLKVSSGNFCPEISGFGQYRLFSSNQFEPGQKTLVYCEVENYSTKTQSTATGEEFRTRLKGSFAIYDTNGKVVQQAEFPTADDIARKRRRDFYMYMPVTIGDLPVGKYVLHALVEDIYGNKTASLDPPLEFSVTRGNTKSFDK